MSGHFSQSTPDIRRLLHGDLPAITGHLLRLDAKARYARFGSAVKDDTIRKYADEVISADTLVFGAFIGGVLRAIGELRGLVHHTTRTAELALSVEPDWQGKGIGTLLFSRLVTAAQNRGVKSFRVLFLNENKRMQRIAAKHHPAHSCIDMGQVEATFDPPRATPLSFALEVAQDVNAFVAQGFRRAMQWASKARTDASLSH